MTYLFNGAISEEMEEIAVRVRPSVVMIETGRGHGSGVVWSASGLVVSNHHVASRGRARLELESGTVVEASVVKSDPVVDLALLQIDPRALATVSLQAAQIGDARRLRVGDVVLAVGNPMGVRGSAAFGIVSGVGNGTWMGRSRTDILHADVKLAPGNSGGPLVDVDGRVVGIASMVMSPGIAVAVPSHVVQRMIGEAPGEEPAAPGRAERRRVFVVG